MLYFFFFFKQGHNAARNPSLGLVHESNAHKQEGCSPQPPLPSLGRALEREMGSIAGPKWPQFRPATCHLKTLLGIQNQCPALCLFGQALAQIACLSTPTFSQTKRSPGEPSQEPEQGLPDPENHIKLCAQKRLRS